MASPADPPPAGAPARRVDTAGIHLIDVTTGRSSTLQALAGAKATLVFFTSNECPVAQAYEQVLAAIAAPLSGRGVALVAVSATASNTRDAISRHRTTARLPYPIYRDVGSHLAVELGATRTSEVALLAPDGRVVYSLSFEIPPGAPAHEVTSRYTLKADARIASFTPHMHDRGKDFRYDAILPDGTTRTLLFVPRYNFNWQFVYVPSEMIALPKGTVLHGIAHFDNSAGNPTNPDPTQSVQWGPQTFEEMMFGFVELIYDEDASSPALQALRTADRQTAAQDLGFPSWSELGAWAKAREAKRSSR